MHHGQTRGGNEKHIVHVKTRKFYENRGNFGKDKGEIIIFTK